MLTVIGDGIAHGQLYALLHFGYIRQTKLVVLVALDYHPAYVFHLTELVIHSDTHTLVAIVVVASV